MKSYPVKPTVITAKYLITDEALKQDEEDVDDDSNIEELKESVEQNTENITRLDTEIEKLLGCRQEITIKPFETVPEEKIQEWNQKLNGMMTQETSVTTTLLLQIIDIICQITDIESKQILSIKPSELLTEGEMSNTQASQDEAMLSLSEWIKRIYTRCKKNQYLLNGIDNGLMNFPLSPFSHLEEEVLNLLTEKEIIPGNTVAEGKLSEVLEDTYTYVFKGLYQSFVDIETVTKNIELNIYSGGLTPEEAIELNVDHNATNTQNLQPWLQEILNRLAFDELEIHRVKQPQNIELDIYKGGLTQQECEELDVDYETRNTQNLQQWLQEILDRLALDELKILRNDKTTKDIKLNIYSGGITPEEAVEMSVNHNETTTQHLQPWLQEILDRLAYIDLFVYRSTYNPIPNEKLPTLKFTPYTSFNDEDLEKLTITRDEEIIGSIDTTIQNLYTEDQRIRLDMLTMMEGNYNITYQPYKNLDILYCEYLGVDQEQEVQSTFREFLRGLNDQVQHNRYMTVKNQSTITGSGVADLRTLNYDITFKPYANVNDELVENKELNKEEEITQSMKITIEQLASQNIMLAFAIEEQRIKLEETNQLYDDLVRRVTELEAKS